MTSISPVHDASAPLTTDDLIERLLATWTRDWGGGPQGSRCSPRGALDALAAAATSEKHPLPSAARVLVAHARARGVDDLVILRALDEPLWIDDEQGGGFATSAYRYFERGIALEETHCWGGTSVRIHRPVAGERPRDAVWTPIDYPTGFDAVLAFLRGEL